MPCHEDRTTEINHASIDRLAQYLCYMCGSLLEDGVFLKYANPDIIRWWNAHHASDIDRVGRRMVSDLRKDPSLTAEQLANDYIHRAELVHAVSVWHKQWFFLMATKVIEELDNAGTRTKDA